MSIKIAKRLVLVLFLGMLCACSPAEILQLKDKKTPNQTESANAENTKTSDNSEQIIGAPVAIPPKLAVPPPPGSINDATQNVAGLSGLQPMKGVNVDTLFSEKIKDTDKRFDRVESAVVDMRKEFESMKPSLIRLIAVESDIQDLTQELDTLLQDPNTGNTNGYDVNEPSAAEDLAMGQNPKMNIEQIPTQLQPEDSEHASAPTIEKAAPKPESKQETVSVSVSASAPAPAPNPNPKAASKETKLSTKSAGNFRIGEHSDKVRIVIDTGSSINATADYDNAENIVVVDLPGYTWNGKSTESFAGSKLVSSYTATQNDQGTTLVVNLKKGSSVLRKGTVDPDDNPNYRYYIDLSP